MFSIGVEEDAPPPGILNWMMGDRIGINHAEELVELATSRRYGAVIRSIFKKD
jgi:hypothetical protein